MTDQVVIAAGATLSIPAGHWVKFRNGSTLRLAVSGTLDVQGTAASRVVFSSFRDDTDGHDSNGDGGASSPAPGDWGYIEYNSGGNVLDWCRIRYAGLVSGAAYAVRCNTGDVVIENNVFEQKYVERNYPLIQMSYSNGAQSPVIRNNSLDNGSFLVRLQFSGTNPLLATVPVIEGNSGAGDGEYGILCQSTAGGPMSPRISSNHLTGTGSGRGVQVIDAESASFLIQGNQLGLYDYGLVLQSVPAGSLVIGNMITGCDDGIYLDSSSPTVMNTTLVNLLRYPIVEVNTCLPQYSGTTLTGTSHYEGISVSGTLSADKVWGDIEGWGYPHVVTDQVVIAAGATLSIPAGHWVKFRNGSTLRLAVSGTLDVQGTAASRVVFSSFRDDTDGHDSNGDGGASSPAPGDWGYIEYNSGGNVLDWCRIRYAGLVSGAAYAVRCNTGDVVIENNVFEQKYVERNYPLIQMSYSNGAQSPVIRNNSLDNGSFLVRLQFSGTNPLLATVPVIEGNSGAGDGEYGILCQSTAGGPMSPRISSNHLTGTGSGRGVQVIDAESASFLIQGNQLGLYDYGLVLQSVPAGSLVIGNMITGCDDGIYLDSSSPTVMNTTLVNLLRYPIVEVNTCLPQYSGTTLTGTSHYEGISVSGTLSTNKVWGDIEGWGYPHVVTDQVVIAAGATLSIPAGHWVKFRNGSTLRLAVSGTLDVQGTAASRVVFSSFRDDTDGHDSNGDGGASSPAPGDWGYIEYNSGGNVLDWCRIRYAGLVSGAAYAVRCNTGDVVIENNVFEQKYVERNYPLIQMSYSNGAQSPVIRNNSLDNGSFLVRLQFSGTNTLLPTVPVIEGNSGAGDGAYGIHCDATSNGPLVPQILGNEITGTGLGRGVYLARTAPATVVRTNTIVGYAEGVFLYDATAQVVENGITQLPNVIRTGFGIYVTNSSDVVVQANVIESFEVGIDGVSGSSNPPSVLTVLTNHIEGNAYGVRLRSTHPTVYTGPEATINNNNLVNNTLYGLYLGAYTDPANRFIDATENWWGTVDPAVVQARIYDYNDAITSAHAVVAPFRTAPIAFDDPAITLAPDAFQVDLYPGGNGSDVLRIGNGGLMALDYLIQEALGAPDSGETDGPVPFDPADAAGVAGARVDVPWLTVTPTAGSISGLGHQDVQLTYLAPADGGRYAGYLVVTSNDLLHDLLVVPISLNVSAVFLESPAADDTLHVGETAEIVWRQWSGTNVESIDLHLYRNGNENQPIEIVSGYTGPRSYDWFVTGAPADSCFIRITAHGHDGAVYHDDSDQYFVISGGTVDTPAESVTTPRANALAQNAPNPFNPMTRIDFDLQASSRAMLTVFDARGYLVRTLLNGLLEGGHHTCTWDGMDNHGSQVPSGVYFYRLQIGEFRETRSMTLVGDRRVALLPEKQRGRFYG